jgi:hypothetical protein
LCMDEVTKVRGTILRGPEWCDTHYCTHLDSGMEMVCGRKLKLVNAARKALSPPHGFLTIVLAFSWNRHCGALKCKENAGPRSNSDIADAGATLHDPDAGKA